MNKYKPDQKVTPKLLLTYSESVEWETMITERSKP